MRGRIEINGTTYDTHYCRSRTPECQCNTCEHEDRTYGGYALCCDGHSTADERDPFSEGRMSGRLTHVRTNCKDYAPRIQMSLFDSEDVRPYEEYEALMSARRKTQ